MAAAKLGGLLGSGKEAEVFEWGSGALKLYRSPARKDAAFREAANLAAAEALGLPVPAVSGVHRIGERWGCRDGARSRALLLRGGAARAGAAPRCSHADGSAAPRDPHQARHAIRSLKARLAANIRETSLLDAAARESLLERLASLPGGDRLCHGDFHPMNILGPFGAERVVDWLDARQGDPAADVCRSYVLMRRVDADLAAAYVEAYGGDGRDRMMAWLPIVAAARLAEGVLDETEELIEMALSG